MADVTIEALIDHGKIIVTHPEKLPLTGRALVTILAQPHKPDWQKVLGLLGSAQVKRDGLAVERETRSEWDEREGPDPD